MEDTLLKEQKIINKIESDKLNKILPLLLTFSFGGVFGFIFEEIFYYIDLGYISKRGITYGPWIPIYGFGAILVILITSRLRKYPFVLLVVSMVVCGIIEFITGYTLHHIIGIRLWNYNEEILNWGNIGGYVCVRSILFFGLSAMFLQYVVYPIIIKLQQQCKPKTYKIIAIVPAVLFAIDIVISIINSIL